MQIPIIHHKNKQKTQPIFPTFTFEHKIYDKLIIKGPLFQMPINLRLLSTGPRWHSIQFTVILNYHKATVHEQIYNATKSNFLLKDICMQILSKNWNNFMKAHAFYYVVIWNSGEQKENSETQHNKHTYPSIQSTSQPILPPVSQQQEDTLYIEYRCLPQ